MQLTYNEEQQILKHGAREFFGERMPVAALRRLRDEGSEAGFDTAAWQDMAAMGWAGVLVPERHGGAEFGYLGMGALLEEAGRTLAASPLVATALIGAPLLARVGTPAQQEALLPAVAAGEQLLALALDEGPRHDPVAVRMTARPEGDGFVLDGEKQFVLDGHVADTFVVCARTAGAPGDASGLGLFLVPRKARGVAVTRLTMVDSRNAANLHFDGVVIGADAVLGAPQGAFEALDAVLDGARAGLAAEMLGGGLEAFERTLAYLKLREQFGVKIGTFQALKHRAALMYCELELARSAVMAALSALDEGRPDADALASLAKAKACDMLELVTNEAVQMHGGIGMTDAEEIGLFLKRARVQQQIFGDASFHRDRYADLKGF
ncbi:MAG: acyl-CoA dehydrogenase family protein [Gammaproteobacteria bacterium]